jgi:hypothetical protein
MRMVWRGSAVRLILCRRADKSVSFFPIGPNAE